MANERQSLTPRRATDDVSEIPDSATMMMERFSQRLRQAMNDKGWRQVDLCREAFGLVTDSQGNRVPASRDAVSMYYNGKALPRNANLEKLARALQVDATWLMPKRYRATVESMAPEVSIHQVPGDLVHLKVNKIVSKQFAARFYAELVNLDSSEP